MDILDLVVRDGELALKPAQYLRDGFGKYVQASRKAGLRYVSKDKTNRFQVRHLARVVDVFSKAGFQLNPASDVSGFVRQVAADLDTATEEANQVAAERGLYPFQAEGVQFLRSRRACLLADDMGLGKTVQTLVSLPENARVVVVCPAVVKGNWANEAAKWRPDYKVHVCKGTKGLKSPQYGELVVMNYELVPEMKNWPANLPDLVVFDEAHYCKNPKAKRTVKCRALATAAHTTWLLTGTPLLNKPQELWGVLMLGGLAQEAYGSWAAFVQAFGGYRGRFGMEWGEPTPAAEEGLSKVALRRKKTEVLKDLPGKRFTTFHCEGKKVQLGVEVDDSVFTYDDLEKLPALEELSAARAELALSKVPFLVSLVEEFEQNEEPVVVFSAHRAPVDTLAQREGWTSVTGGISHEERTQRVADFQAGRYKGIACTIQAAGVGITLTHASNCVFVDRAFTPALNWQAEDRICRIGQTRGCFYTFMVANHPLDRHVNDVLERKRELIEATVEKVTTKNTNAEKLRELAALMDRIQVEQSEVKPTKAFREPQTEQEKWAAQALLTLSALDPDCASLQNEVGFNRLDGQFGKSLAEQIISKGGLTEKQWPHAIKICRKYKRQVGECPE